MGAGYKLTSQKVKEVKLPFDFIDNYLPYADPVFLKVYLYGLRQCYSNAYFDFKNTADALGLSENDVISAWQYWQKLGLVKLFDGGIEFCEFAKNLDKNGRDEHTITDKEFKHKITYIEKIYGNMLKPQDLDVIREILYEHMVPYDVLVLCIAFCVRNDKRNFKYILKTVLGWMSDGLDNAEKIDKYFFDRETNQKTYAVFIKMFGVKGRDFTDTEKKYIDKWVKELKIETSLIKEAFEKTVMNTGKIAFSYMDKILVKSPQTKVEPTKKAYAPKTKANNFTPDKKTDFSKLEDLINKKWNEN